LPRLPRPDSCVQARAIYAAYQGRLIRAIVMLKFERIAPLAVWFAERPANVVQREHLAADIVVPVSLHRQSEKGYNQADLIARPLARKLGLPIERSC
jgi:predicted amidophosphoribosyltransferase